MGQKLRDAKRNAEFVTTDVRAEALTRGSAGIHFDVANFIGQRQWLHRTIFFLVSLATLLYIKNPPLILIIGSILGLSIANPDAKICKKAASLLLGLSIAGIGLGVSVSAVLKSLHHSGLIALMIALTLVLGTLVAKLLKLPLKFALLLSCGTAICGGSAIMATSDAIGASEDETVVSLATIFVLNAIALICLPMLGHFFAMSQTAFGTWAALAIHDTGSVMAATMNFGSAALETGTAIKVLRALFIVPLVVGVSLIWRDTNTSTSRLKLLTKLPWFIPAFFVGVLLANLIPAILAHQSEIMRFSKYCMLAALLLMGSLFKMRSFRTIGLKAFVGGVCLWLPIAIVTFFLAS